MLAGSARQHGWAAAPGLPPLSPTMLLLVPLLVSPHPLHVVCGKVPPTSLHTSSGLLLTRRIRDRSWGGGRHPFSPIAMGMVLWAWCWWRNEGWSLSCLMAFKGDKPNICSLQVSVPFGAKRGYKMFIKRNEQAYLFFTRCWRELNKH